MISSSLDLYIKSSAKDTDLQVTLSEVRPDGQETYVQNGWLRASHRKLDVKRSTAVDPFPTHLKKDAATLPAGAFTLVLERLRHHDAPEAAAASASEEEEEEVRRPLCQQAYPSGRHSRSGVAPACASASQQQAAAVREAAQVLLGEGPVDYDDVVSGESMCYGCCSVVVRKTRALLMKK